MINDKLKDYMKKQHENLTSLLNSHFPIPIFVDESGADEVPEDNHFFLVVYGDLTSTNVGQAYQDVYVIYFSQNNPSVEEDTLDIISLGTKVNGFEFYRTVKERFQLENTNNYVDQVNVIFRRKLKYEY